MSTAKQAFKKIEGKKFRIILADDSAILRDTIKDILNNLKNVEIIGEAVNGLEALQVIEDKKPDLILLDIRMPEMNGIEVLKKIREKKIEIITCMLTGCPCSQYGDRCFTEGADYFFEKDSDIEQMLKVISTLAIDRTDI